MQFSRVVLRYEIAGYGVNDPVSTSPCQIRSTVQIKPRLVVNNELPLAMGEP